MNNETIMALFTFTIVSQITPGPNNIMLMSSGTNFGVRKSLPHVTGIVLGISLLVFLVGSGLTKIFTLYPILQQILKVLSISYLLYLSYKVAVFAPVSSNTNSDIKPFTFIQAAMFQWVNPKLWTMALSAVTLYAPSNTTQDVLKVTLMFGCVSIPTAFSWVILGGQIRKMLSSHIKLKVFNFIMATLLLSSLYFVF